MSNRIAAYKNIAMEHAVGNAELVRALDETAVHDPASLAWTRLYPFIRVPDTQEEVGRFLLFEVNVPRISEKNDLLADMEFVVVVLCHRDAMRTPHGATACDYIGGLVMDTFNRNRAFSGGRLRLQSDEASVLTGGIYHYRTMIFGTREFNGSCGP